MEEQREDVAAGGRGGRGDADLSESVYSHLRAIAQNKLAQERPGHTLQATALVHEAFMRLERGGLGSAAADGGVEGGRSRFYWAAAEAMRRILIEHARARKAEKRGGGRKRADWTDGIAEGVRIGGEGSGVEDEDFESLDAAIVRLGEKDARAADVVRLRFYAGLSVEQAAEALGITPRTAKRDWEYARAWLRREMGQDSTGP